MKRITKINILLCLICFVGSFLYSAREYIYGVNYLYPTDMCSHIEKEAVLEHGDINAYHFIVDSIRNDGFSPKGNCLGYALIMAAAFDYTPANYDAYISLRDTFGDINKMDDDTKDIALFFLKKGAKGNDVKCLKRLKELNVKY